MQESIQLPTSQQGQNYNQYAFSQIISPKGRRLVQNINTASNQSLAYSNSTLQKFTDRERSPPYINFDSFSLNNQNVNILNFRHFDRFDKKQQTFGLNKDLTEKIQFQKINQEQSIDNLQDDDSRNQIKERIRLPCFLSYENSPKNYKENSILIANRIKQNQESQNDSIQQIKDKVIQSKKVFKVNPFNKNTLKQNLNKKEQQNITTSSKSKTQKNNLSNSKQKSYEKTQVRSKSPLSYVVTQSEKDSKDIILSLKQKVKQLEYSLKVQSITTQELRAKVNILNELLEQKFLQKNGINFKLFKNSSLTNTSIKSVKMDQINKSNTNKSFLLPAYQNIDLYVEMKLIQKSKQELQINFERIRSQLQQKSNQIIQYKQKCEQLSNLLNYKTRQQTKTQTSYLCGQSYFGQNKSEIKQIQYTCEDNQKQNNHERIYELEDQRQTLLEYIENQKRLIQAKDIKINQLQLKNSNLIVTSEELQSHLHLLEEKQKRFTEIERPKLLMQINELTTQINLKEEQMQKLEMQNNLIELKLNQGGLSGSKQVSKLTLRQKESPTKSVKSLNQSSEWNKDILNKLNQKLSSTAPDAISLIMLQQQQLMLLKKERDYFRCQIQSLKQVKNLNFSLQLQNKQLLSQIQNYKRLIEQCQ